MTRRLTFAVPGDLATPTGGFAYDRRVIEELRQRGWLIEVLNIGDNFPHPSNTELANAHAMLLQAPADIPIAIDGLAFGVMDDFAKSLAQTHKLIALVHHPLAMETGLTTTEANSLRASERAALAGTRHVITTSTPIADILVLDFGVRRDRITVALPGNDALSPSSPSTDGICRLLTVGSLVPRKGYDLLIAALAQIGDLPWRLMIVGDPTRDREFASTLTDAVQRTGLSDNVIFAGSLSDQALAAAYRCSDVFVTASHFEGYGMAATTAIASGLPVVATTGGALAQTVGEAGLLVAPNDVAALTAALRSVISEPSFRDRLRAASLQAAKGLPTWSDTADCFAAAIERTT